MEASKSEEKIYYVSSKSRVTAILLCCLGFLGLGGVHRLYVKKWMTGLLYLMTFGLFFLGTAYDLHQLIQERFKDADGFPLYSDGSMHQNYRRRTPKGRTPVGIKIVVPIALLAFALNLATMSQHEAAYQQQKAQQQAEKQQQKEQAETAKEKKEGKRPLSELELVENFKMGYRDGNYGASGNALDALRKNYPDSSYIAMLEKDYPDLPAKVQAARAQQQVKDQQRKAEDQQRADAFNNTMSQFSIYAGYGTGEGNLKLRVFVTSDWYSLDKGRKMAFAQRAYQVMKLSGLDYPMFEVRCRDNGRRVAHYGDLFGMSIDE